MRVPRPSGISRLVLALACCLALLAPAGAAPAAAGEHAAAAPALARAPAGSGQTLLRDPAPGSLVTPGATRDDRGRPGLALLGAVALAVAATWTVVAARRATRAAGRRAAASGARAPPLLQPAAS
jgi:hypothetical protein